MLHREHILEMLESWKKNTKVKLDIAYYGCDSPLSFATDAAVFLRRVEAC